MAIVRWPSRTMEAAASYIGRPQSASQGIYVPNSVLYDQYLITTAIFLQFLVT